MHSQIRVLLTFMPIFCLITILLSILGFVPSKASGAATVVTDVRVGQDGKTTRLVLDLTSKISFKVFALDKPYRIVIDLPEVGWRLPPRPLPQGIGMLKNMRYGLFQQGVSRVVLDVNKPPKIEKKFILKPEGKSGYRLVVDFSYVSEKDFANLRMESICLLYTSPSPRDAHESRMPSSA